MQPLISIVIPVYKVEKYLERCILSITNQSYSNLEIILVDDGSPDDCGLICDNWAKIDNRIQVIHKENGGLSDARNAGIKIATGEFITFIDSDDYVLDNYIEYLLELIFKYNADISICNFYQFFEETNRKVFVGGKVEKIFNSEEAIETMLYDRDFYTSAWGKLYRKSFFYDIDYPKGKFYEDLATTYKLLEKATVIAYGPEGLYCYVQRKGSILNSKFNKKNLQLIDIVNDLYDDLNKRYPNIKNAIFYRKIGAYMDVANMIINSKDSNYNDELDRIINNIRINLKYIIISRDLNIMQKWLLVSAIGGKLLYRITYKIQITLKNKIKGSR